MMPLTLQEPPQQSESPAVATPKPVRPKTTRRRVNAKDLIAQYHHHEMLCRYKNKLCMIPRARKRRGGLHTFCEMHREAANRNQRRLDLRKRIQKRQRETTGVLQGVTNPITSSTANARADASASSSPVSPSSTIEEDTRSPHDSDSDTSSVATPALESGSVPEPANTPVALKDEDLYALRWLFAVDDAARLQDVTVKPDSMRMQWA